MAEWRLAVEQRLTTLGVPPLRRQEIVDEVATYLQDRFDEFLASGRPPEDARALALANLETDRFARELAAVERRVTADIPRRPHGWHTTEHAHGHALAGPHLCRPLDPQGAGLMLRSFARLAAVDPGFDPRQVVTMRLLLPAAKYGDVTAWTAFHDALAGQQALSHRRAARQAHRVRVPGDA